MIVDTMTLEEIHRELHADFPYAQRVVAYKVAAFKPIVLKTRQFPIRRRFSCVSNEKKNRFFIQLTAVKRSDWDNPQATYYSIYTRPEGLYCAMLDPGDNLTFIYPPHFFSRYRERIIKDDTITPEDLIHLFVNRFWTTCSLYLNPDDETKDWEQLVEEGPVDIVTAHTDGVMFGERHQQVVLNKTIIPESMLYPNQVPFWEHIYLTNWSSLREQYPERIVDYMTNLEFDYYQNKPEATPEALDALREKYKRE